MSDVLDLDGASKGARTAGQRAVAHVRGKLRGTGSRLSRAAAAKIHAAAAKAYKSGQYRLERGGGIALARPSYAPSPRRIRAAYAKMEKAAARIRAKREAAQPKGRKSRRPKK